MKIIFNISGKVIKSSLAFLIVLAFIIGCKTKPIDVSLPPEGFANNTTLKIAYATGALDLVETKFPIPDNIQEHKDITYKTIDSLDLKLDIYHTKDIAADAPLLIFVHGGSWKKGNKHDYLIYLNSFAQKGYVTATVQYRLTNVAKYPAQLNDVEDAVRWLKLHAEEYYIDKNKVAMVGGSAGAHLVMMNAYTNTKEDLDENGISADVQAIVNFYGPVDLTAEVAVASDAVEYLIGKPYDEALELYKNASPLYFISKKAPPTLTFHGTLDELVPYEQAGDLDRTLKEAGVVSEYHELKGWPHTMDMAVEVNEYCQYYMDKFFEKHLQKN